MSIFDFAGITVSEPIPPELQPEIDASVRRFEEKLGGMLVMAKMNGWLEDYRKEVTSLAIKAYGFGGKTNGSDRA